ncbi:inositol phosphate kinase 2 [Aphomia sociella]
MNNDHKKTKVHCRQHRSIHGIHYDIQKTEEVVTRPFKMGSEREIQAYDRQVAGHTATKDTKYLGLLQCNDGTILKPILKEAQKREVEFYERLSKSTDPDLVEMRKFVPRYYGCKKVTYNGHEQEYIILEDLTKKMLEPCIMDIKIGKRTWDPLATEEKIKSEQMKYARCKQEFGFCIPGFQVYRVSTGRLHKYDKEYGKKLHGDMVREAILRYLNGWSGAAGACRPLLSALSSALWRLQRWARRQAALRLYAASLLLLYDAAKLPRGPGGTHRGSMENYPTPIRRRSIHSTHSPASAGSNFSGLLSSKGPVYKKVKSIPLAPMTLAQTSFAPPPPINSPWSDALERVNHSHSFDHNYDDKLCKMKMNFRAILDQMSSDGPDPNPWGTVKIIDFAHVFFNEEEDKGPDKNFIEGLDNFVQIIESILSETNDQVI